MAAARTSRQVLGVVLEPTLAALNAVAGTVLVVRTGSEWLDPVTAHGYGPSQPSVWQGGPLAENGPVREALRRHEALYFEDAEALRRAHPGLTALPSDAAPVASAVLPLVLEDQVLGALVVDFREPHHFTEDERRFLRTLASQGALALDRVRLLESLGQQVQSRTRGLEEAQQTAELLASLGDTLQSARTPEEAARLTLGQLGPALHAHGMLMVEFTPGATAAPLGQPILWGSPPPGQPDFMPSSVPGAHSAPLLWQAAQTGRALYLDGPTGEAPQDTAALACAIEPIHSTGMDSRLEDFLVAWRPVGTGAWSPAERALLARAAATLGLVFGRAAALAALQERTAALDTLNAQLEGRSRALEAFAQLTRDLGVQNDPAALVRRAQEVLLSLLPPGHALYWEPQDGRWRLRAQSGQGIHPELQRVLEAGLPTGQTPTLDGPWQTREATYQDRYPAGQDVRVDLTEQLQSVAALPIWRGGAPCGVLNITTVVPHTWQEVDRVVLTTVARSLGLALERAESMRQLAHSNAELRTANEELEAFAYSVSHDLRAPVRHIKGFGTLLRNKLGPDLDLKANHYLNVIDESAGRMNTLIDALLELSRTARQPLTPVRVDLAALVVSVQAELVSEVVTGEPERSIEWRIHNLPPVYGDQDLLRQVMVNLLSNALKYTRPRPQAVIEVWAEEDPHGWTVSVRDNGVGFDPRYGARLFAVFQRLHHQNEFEGTGVGLANVRRIVARHRGTVSAQGQAGAGATFSFTLPRPG
jgi:signal transduction histidine kinase